MRETSSRPWPTRVWLPVLLAATPWALAQPSGTFPPVPAEGAGSIATEVSSSPQPPEIAPPAASTATAVASAPTPHAPPSPPREPATARPIRAAGAWVPERCRALTLGYRLGVGVSGARRSPVPSHSLAVGVELPLGAGLRYHGTVALHELRGWYGALLSPLGLGYPLAVLDRVPWRLRLEPALDLFEVEELFTRSGHAALVGAGAWFRISAFSGPWLLALTPIGVHVRYLYLSGSNADPNRRFGTGIDGVFRLDFGRQLP